MDFRQPNVSIEAGMNKDQISSRILFDLISFRDSKIAEYETKENTYKYSQ